jgi:prepilin-type N-terminal cleavage/methylation domain-containing protein
MKAVRSSQGGGGNGGYTLVEVMLAVTILSIAIGSFLALLSHGFKVLRDTRRYQIANGALTREMERVRTLPYSQILTLSNAWTPPESGYVGRRNVGQWGITESNVLQRVQISVIWTNRGGRPVTNSLTTLIAMGGINPQ